MEEVNLEEAQPKHGHKSIKSKVAMFIGYNGQSFNGMQYQRDTGNTIQNILHLLLLKKAFILESNSQNLRRIKWSRAGRTDKGVHALSNGISLCLQFSEEYMDPHRNLRYDKVKELLNKELPNDIRVFGVYKCGKSFDMRHDATSRIYNYIAPLCLFQPYEEFLKGTVLDKNTIQGVLQRLNKLCGAYLNTHSYHNFTKGHKYKDPRCERYMMKMTVEQVTEQPFVRFTLIGQSFIYHQIRKMVGMLIKIYSQGLGDEAVKQALTCQKYEPYLAPGQGLYLNTVTFEAYNQHQPNGLLVAIPEQDKPSIQLFRQYLENMIIKKQQQNQVFTKWLMNRNQYLEGDEPSQQQDQEQDKRPERQRTMEKYKQHHRKRK